MLTYLEALLDVIPCSPEDILGSYDCDPCDDPSDDWSGLPPRKPTQPKPKGN